jgi:hypothetical protein
MCHLIPCFVSGLYLHFGFFTNSPCFIFIFLRFLLLFFFEKLEYRPGGMRDGAPCNAFVRLFLEIHYSKIPGLCTLFFAFQFGRMGLFVGVYTIDHVPAVCFPSSAIHGILTNCFHFICIICPLQTTKTPH